jgi:predicted transcriptional regulator of viral defense system
MERLKKTGIVPISSDILYSLYSDLKQPKDKVSDLERKGLIIRIKRDLYVVSQKVHGKQISRELVANHLYSPSYVSLETALAYYGLIPERVYSVRSVCTKMHKNYDTPLGHFEFVKASSNYFSIGIRQEIVNDEYAFLIASPEKALCDKIICTPNIRIQSVKAMREYLEKDLRIEMSALQNFDVEIIKQCAEFGRKKGELTQLLNILKK